MWVKVPKCTMEEVDAMRAVLKKMFDQIDSEGGNSADLRICPWCEDISYHDKCEHDVDLYP